MSGRSFDAISPELLADALNEKAAEDWADFLDPIFFEDDTAGGKVISIVFSHGSEFRTDVGKE